MDEIRSAYEIAMEKVERLGRPSEEDVKKWKYVPQGQEIALGYFRNERNLVAELGKYDEDTRHHVIAGAQEVLLRNIDVPKNDSAKRRPSSSSSRPAKKSRRASSSSVVKSTTPARPSSAAMAPKNKAMHERGCTRLASISITAAGT